jgi:hypothetical protein
MLRISIVVLTAVLLLATAGAADAAKKKPHPATHAHKKSYIGCINYLVRKGYTRAGSSNWCSAHGYSD